MSMKQHNRRGAMLVLVAFVIVVLLVGAVFSVDVAYMHMVRAELRTATDAAARAGAEALARTQDMAAAREAAISTAAMNMVAGESLNLDPADIEIGGLNPGDSPGKFTFALGQNPLTAVRIVGRRDQSSADGAVGLFFARILSANQFEPVMDATAASNVRDVCLVLDISGSMGTTTSTGTRLSDLRNAVNIFINEVQAGSPRTLLSLVSYSSAPRAEIALTSNFDSIRTRVAGFKAGGMTAIGDALTMGSDSLINDPLARTYAAKTVILMTDGNHNMGPSPAVTVDGVIGRGHQVHTITFSSGANQELMRNVAHRTLGGIHLHADGGTDLANAFREIARTLAVVLID